jgi:transcriptional regulator NrdR family protein
MQCPKCGNVKTYTTDSRDNRAGRWRRRQCPECLAKFSTQEVMHAKAPSGTASRYFGFKGCRVTADGPAAELAA